jgi:CHASE2 domain
VRAPMKSFLMRVPGPKAGLERRRRARGLIALGLAWVFQALLQEAHFFDRYDQADADHYARTTPLAPRFSDHITIVVVTEDDYRDVFGSRSPLDSAALLRLVAAVQSYKPRAIGVDFLTADWTTPLPASSVGTNQTIVWARDGRPATDLNQFSEIPILTQWSGVVGYLTPPAGLCFAAPVYQPDADGVVRTYSTVVEVQRPGASQAALYPTMAYVLASAYSDGTFDCHGDPDRAVKRIRVTGENHNIRVLTASDVLRDAKLSRRFEPYLAGRIVLLGGAFAGRDLFATSSGYISGVTVLAHAIESEISGSVRELPIWANLLIGLVVSTFLYYFLSPLRSPLDVLASILFLLGFSLFTGWFCYHYVQLFLPIASGLFSLPIGIIFEHHLACEHGEPSKAHR